MRAATVARRVFYMMLALTTLGTLLALGLRVLTTIRFGAITPFPIEGPGLYAIWKAQHGHPVYEWPTRGFFPLALYNFLFYEIYARVLALIGIRSMWLPVAAKLLTLSIAAVGVLIQYVCASGILKRRGFHPNGVLLVAFAVCTWFGPGFIGPWAVSARPDVAASALALAAFAVCVSVVDGRAPARLVVASVLFYLAWGFKQSAVLTLAGVCLYFLAVRRSIRDVALVFAPFAVLAAIAIAIGGEAYRYNVLVAPSVARGFEWWTSWFYLRGVMLPNLPVWLAVAFASRRLFISRPDGDGWPVDRDLTSLFVCTTAVTFVGGFVLMAKNGSALNHGFEFWVISALFASVACGALLASPETSPSVHGIAAASLVLPLAFIVGHLADSERVIRAIGLRASVERMRLGSERQHAVRLALHDRLDGLPRPVYIDDELLAQPWYANDSRYPAIVLDHVFYDAATAQNLLEHGGVVSLIDRRYFGTVVAYVPPWYVFRAARSAGYVEVARLPWFLDAEAVVLVRSEKPDPSQIRRPTRRRTP